MTESATDFVVSARWVVPVIPHGQVLDHYSIVVRGGHITQLLPTVDLSDELASLPRTSLPRHLVTAGLINTHGHAAMTLLRGYADDLVLMDWLNNHIWPVEGRFVDETFVYDGTSLAVAEMIGSGTTCAADTYFFPNAVSRAMTDQGFRGQVCLPVVQFPNAWAGDENHHIEKALALHEQICDQPLITTAFAPHAPYTVSDDGFRQIVEHAGRLDIPIHLHLHETREEIETALADSGQRPLSRMLAFGVLAQRLQAVHMTEIADEEFSLLAQHSVQISHCPDSNMKLASGICPVQSLLDHGVNVALGTDGAASNNNLDLLAEARSAALLSKVSTGDPTSISAADALAMATINGARLLGLEADIGSLEAGKRADMIALDFSGIELQPIHHPISQLIYVASGHHVSHNWINGNCLYADGEFTQLDAGDLGSRIESWRQQIQGAP